MIDLNFVSTNDLVQELFSRFDSIIIHGVKENFKNKDKYIRDYKGLFSTALGLCESLKDIMKEDFYNSYTEKIADD